MSVIDPLNVPAEADRLESLGVLEVTHHGAGNKEKTSKLVCIGYGVTGREYDFLLFAGPYGMKHKHTLRAICVHDIFGIKVAENQSFDRYAIREAKRLATPPSTIHLYPRR